LACVGRVVGREHMATVIYNVGYYILVGHY